MALEPGFFKFETRTETFQEFMGDAFDIAAGHGLPDAILRVRSEAEARLVETSSGLALVYTETSIFQVINPAVDTITLETFLWPPMVGRYPIEMWAELRMRTNDAIRQWIRGGDGGTGSHGQQDEDLIWIVEPGVEMFGGIGSDEGWAIHTDRNYLIGDGATLNCRIDADNFAFIITITIPISESIAGNLNYFNREGNITEVNLSFHPIASALLNSSRLFGSNSFTLRWQE